jgi:alkanesulfonate monooxygenase SsuD/methylene tetrahydromethanopterin reductase-like flavin-dependent oxidoreductase (luciferase family)
MKIGLFSSTIDGSLDGVVADAARAERDGFASYWVPQIFGPDALSTLTVVGREVPRIELGTSVIPTYPRHPMMLAQQALTANAASVPRHRTQSQGRDRGHDGHVVRQASAAHA